MSTDEYPPVQIDRDVWFTEERFQSVFGSQVIHTEQAMLSDDICRESDSRLRTALALADAARCIEMIGIEIIAYVRPEGVVKGKPKAYDEVYAGFPSDTNERLMTWLNENH